MIPGEILTQEGDIRLNADRPTVTLEVANSGDRPIQVGSHYHFAEANPALDFDRAAARGMRLDIPAGIGITIALLHDLGGLPIAGQPLARSIALC